MSIHPFDLPEVLAVVGNFLPLWEQEYDPVHNRYTTRFNPATLRASDIKPSSPSSGPPTTTDKELVTRLFSLHFRVVRVIDSTTGLLSDCTQLVELTIDTCTTTSFEWLPPSPLKALVRANPGLRRLDWRGRSKSVSFDLEDVDGLENLEDLRLAQWGFTSGRLPRLLRKLARTLKTLHLSSIHGITSGELMAPPLFLGLDTDRNRIQTNATTTQHGDYLKMERLETIVVGSRVLVSDFPAELVRCCPALRELTVNVFCYPSNYNDPLADSVRIYCPKLHSLTLDPQCSIRGCVLDLVKNTSTGGLRKLHFGPAGDGDSSLTLDVLRLHATTLEDLRLSSSDSADFQLYARLFTECQPQGGDTSFPRRRLEIGPCMSPRPEVDLEDADLEEARILSLWPPGPVFHVGGTFRTMNPERQEKIAGRMGEIVMQQLFEKVETLKSFTVDGCVFTSALVTTAPPTNPLNIPEILRRIGEFLPLWTHDSSKTTTSTVPSISPFQRPTQWGKVDPRWRSQLTFTPQNLLACIIVSKSWYKTLLPVLWFTFDCETMAIPVPGSDFFERCSDLFRIYRWHGVVQDTLRWRAQKRVVRRNSHLVSLEWFGLPTVMIDPENFRGLQRLQHLKLYDWVVVDRRLFQVLKIVQVSPSPRLSYPAVPSSNTSLSRPSATLKGSQSPRPFVDFVPT
ncbi:hypothetical protein BGZ90_009637 [Linnemannia elongata]|nr:hypothetical protein BGZ90_009637 [Linnemannia elongata]